MKSRKTQERETNDVGLYVTKNVIGWELYRVTGKCKKSGLVALSSLLMLGYCFCSVLAFNFVALQ
jgi:hypothetical protein